MDTSPCSCHLPIEASRGWYCSISTSSTLYVPLHSATVVSRQSALSQESPQLHVNLVEDIERPSYRRGGASRSNEAQCRQLPMAKPDIRQHVPSHTSHRSTRGGRSERHCRISRARPARPVPMSLSSCQMTCVRIYLYTVEISHHMASAKPWLPSWLPYGVLHHLRPTDQVPAAIIYQ